MEENNRDYAEDELLQKVGEILTKRDDEGYLTEIVSEVTDKIRDLSAKIVKRDDEISKLKNDIESLRDANMALLRKQGAKVDEEEKSERHFIPDTEEAETEEEVIESVTSDYN